MARSENASGNPICVVCNRPFDPTKPGALPTMGPTCAKKMGASKFSRAAEALSLFSFEGDTPDSEDDAHFSPRLEALQKLRKTEQDRKSFSALQKAQMPKTLVDKYNEAKMAFDEMYRNFCKRGLLVYGDEAQLKYEDVRQREGIETHNLRDPLLEWLEPEFDLEILFDEPSGILHYYRVINERQTLLSIDYDESPLIKDLYQKILNFTMANRQYRVEESQTQLSF